MRQFIVSFVISLLVAFVVSFIIFFVRTAGAGTPYEDRTQDTTLVMSTGEYSVYAADSGRVVWPYGWFQADTTDWYPGKDQLADPTWQTVDTLSSAAHYYHTSTHVHAWVYGDTTYPMSTILIQPQPTLPPRRVAICQECLLALVQEKVYPPPPRNATFDSLRAVIERINGQNSKVVTK